MDSHESHEHNYEGVPPFIADQMRAQHAYYERSRLIRRRQTVEELLALEI